MSHNGEDNSIDQSADPLIDSLLEEHLGGTTPPDQTKQILERLSRESSSATEDSTATGETLVSTRRTAHARLYKSARSKSVTGQLLFAASMASLAGVIGFFAWRVSVDSSNVANVENPNPASVVESKVEPRDNIRPEIDSTSLASDDVATPEESVVPSTVVVDSNEDAPGPVESIPVQYFAESEYKDDGPRVTPLDIVEFVNAEFDRQWQTNGIKPAPAATDEVWLARVFDRMIGRAPTDEELRKSLPRSESLTDDDRQRVVKMLTDSPNYRPEFNQHWAQIIGDRLLPGDSAREVVREGVTNEEPYNELVASAVVSYEDDVVRLCNEVLGARSACAKCHEGFGPSKKQLELFANGFANHREVFALALAESDDANETAVNQVWEHFFGRSLTSVDGLAAAQGNEAALRPLLKHLTQQFIASDGDIRQLVQWVAMSKPFGLSDEVHPENQDDSIVAVQPLFARSYSRNQFADSISKSLEKVRKSDVDLVGLNADPAKTMASKTPNNPDEEAIKKAKKVWRQDIDFMNHDPDRSNILSEHGLYLRRLAKSGLPKDKQIDHVFLSVAERLPTSAERKTAAKILDSQSSNTLLGLRDIWWAISKGQ